MKKLFLAIIAGLTMLSCRNNHDLLFITSTNTEKWVESGDFSLKEYKTGDQTTVIIDTMKKEQIVNGFGGCLNELGWDALSIIDSVSKDQILKGFFLPGAGLHLNYCRLPIGANDYARDWYSLDDSINDFEMKYFNISRDKQVLIPYIQKVMKYNPEITFWGSPWCPPAWMKKNKHYACYPDKVNDLTEQGRGKEGTDQFVQDKKYLDAYAMYFTKYIEAYQKEGVKISAIHVQNEPSSCQNFPCCVWTAKSLNNFIGNYLGPEFEKQQVNTEIWLGTIERPFVEKVDTVLQDERSKKYVKGVGFQWAGKDAIPGVHKKYPGIQLMQTESECGDGSNDWKAAQHTWDLMKHYFNNGVSVYMYWNLVLDETGKSRWGWKQNSLITINTKTREIIYNPEYYLFMHLSHFIKPGARELSVSGTFNDILAFKNKDGKTIVIIQNAGQKEMDLSVKISNKLIQLRLKPLSFNTLVI